MHAGVFRHGWREGEGVSRCDTMLIVSEWVNLVKVYMKVHYKNPYTFL